MPANPKSILAATDLSTEGNHAVERAAMVAGQKGIAGIRVLHVVEPPWLGGMPRASSQVASARRVLGRVALEIGRENGVSLDQSIRAGRPLQVIAEESKRSDLLVLGASTNHLLRDLILGSTAERLLTKTPASILAVRNRPTADYRRVLVALDFSRFDDNALAYARALAPGARLDLMHVFDTAFEGKMRYAGVGSDAITEYRSRTWEAAWREMNAVADRVPGRLRPVVVNGHIASNVVREGRKSNADLIVVGHPRRSWLSNLVMRRTAAQVLSDAHSDILVVH
jgi:nucleotide-binding universal stress UspA family protein